ncbi:unnamed protein product [Oppiella nova]|uniref:C2H2-type domain-containing protein n=1 Tax=Oppiella nova TaxID=334625 RepID=A0A7R9MG45_9ACAR|nr:unnamed protein product [Oppiella nova]CAG2176743.1 unnamed protein product [Oppiella nova]
MKRHMNTHTAETVYRCHWPECDYTTTNPIRLNNHINKQHKGLDDYLCSYPDCQFTTKKCKAKIKGKGMKLRGKFDLKYGSLWFDNHIQANGTGSLIITFRPLAAVVNYTHVLYLASVASKPFAPYFQITIMASLRAFNPWHVWEGIGMCAETVLT